MGSEKRLRVLFLASFFPKPGNLQMGTWALCQAQALAKLNLDLVVVSFTSWVPPQVALTRGAKAYANCPREYTWSGDVKVYYPPWLYYPVPPLKRWSYVNPTPYLQFAWQFAQSQLRKLILEFQPDLIFCHHSLPNGWGIAKFFPEIPLVIQEHDIDEIEDCWRYPQRRLAFEAVITHARATLTVADRMTHTLKTLFPKAEVFTHHNGVEPISPELLDRPRPQELQDKLVILCCAMFAARKGGPLLIESFARIADRYPRAILRIVGSGPDAETMQQTIQRLGVTQQVQMVGRKPHAEVLQEMVWADCFALVGWDEPYGVVYLEAMAAGKPIICCNDGGINDVIIDGVHGLTVPPRDITATAIALERMLSNEDKLRQMGDNGRKLIFKELTWERKAQDLLNIFEASI